MENNGNGTKIILSASENEFLETMIKFADKRDEKAILSIGKGLAGIVEKSDSKISVPYASLIFRHLESLGLARVLKRGRFPDPIIYEIDLKLTGKVEIRKPRRNQSKKFKKEKAADGDGDITDNDIPADVDGLTVSVLEKFKKELSSRKERVTALTKEKEKLEKECEGLEKAFNALEEVKDLF